jgi:hypothetical protein
MSGHSLPMPTVGITPAGVIINIIIIIIAVRAPAATARGGPGRGGAQADEEGPRHGRQVSAMGNGRGSQGIITWSGD